MIENKVPITSLQAAELWDKSSLVDGFWNIITTGFEKLGTGNTKEAINASPSSVSIQNPGLKQSFNVVASGKWKVIYAPHMTTIAGLFGGAFDVQYILDNNGRITSHAKYNFPIFGRGYLSASGTFGSVNEDVCRVDFDQVWVKILPSTEEQEEEPYAELNQVPMGFIKDAINSIGKLFFFEQVSMFPVSFLDNELIIFDFEVLGTRICARKSNS